MAWPDYWICLGISVLTYMPFVLAANKMMAADSQSKQDTDTTTETVKA
ncbi:PTS cellobiose transporter subunit IIC [Lactiplantibacillus plantarum]|nr:PTS cellobiose transporter subunit IIC [Lactiplantibacillus plantarum]